MTKIIELIETQATRGAGTHEDPVRNVYQLWTKDGRLVAEHDPESQGRCDPSGLAELPMIRVPRTNDLLPDNIWPSERSWRRA